MSYSNTQNSTVALSLGGSKHNRANHACIHGMSLVRRGSPPPLGELGGGLLTTVFTVWRQTHGRFHISSQISPRLYSTLPSSSRKGR
jgi:hypothetical protein